MSRPSRWRYLIVRGISRLPGPVRRGLWRGRRAASRAVRSAHEARGDWSRSRPALHAMDIRLERQVGTAPGFFVEAGANDGFAQSNTYSFERIHGWRGLLIEPVPELAREAARARRRSRVVNCALVATETAEPVCLRYGGLMTVVSGTRTDDSDWVAAAHAVAQEEPEHQFTVPGRTLSSLLDEMRVTEVGLLSLDVEGYEAEALMGLDFKRHAPRFVLVEVHDDPAQAAVEEALGSRYRLRERMSPIDVLYARDDQAEVYERALSERASTLP